MNIVETSRWPKASYSASSIICGVMPSREAVSRSIMSVACSPWFCWSLATSRNSGSACSFLDELRHPERQFLGIRIFQAVLELGAADAVFHRQVLHRLHEERDPLDLGQFRLQLANDLRRIRSPLSLLGSQRLEVDLDAAAVERRVGAVDADE